MDCDTTSADLLLDRVLLFVEEGWQMPAAIEAEQTIRDLTREGFDANAERFENWGYRAADPGPGEVYSPSQRARRIAAGVSVDIKDLMVTGSLMGGGGGEGGGGEGLGIRKLEGITSISVATEASAKLNLIALGQMQHPKWRYHHNFLAVGATMKRRVYAAVLAAMKFGVGGRLPFHNS